jgi:hypothetical protein
LPLSSTHGQPIEMLYWLSKYNVRTRNILDLLKIDKITM